MIKIAIAGTLPCDKTIRQSVDDLFGQIGYNIDSIQKKEQTSSVRQKNQKKSSSRNTPPSYDQNSGHNTAGARGEETGETPWLLISPCYTHPSWTEWLHSSGLPIKCITTPDQEKEEAEQTICLHTSQRDFVGENLCADADLLAAVWDESSDAMNGSTLELLRMARRKKLACVWISARTGKIFWPEETLYMPFSIGKLETLCREKAVSPLDPVEVEEILHRRKIPFLRVGMFLQSSYLKKYRAAASAIAPTEDRMLRKDYRMPESFRDREPLRDKLLEQFSAFDQSAVLLNRQYQGALYWQAILPFIITLFLALGFYPEDILGALPVPVRILQVLSGIGFLMNAYLNLYKYRLDNSRTVKGWQTSFVQCRGIAELLRVLLHFVPFGIGLDLRNLCSEDPVIYHTIRKITFDNLPGTTDVDQKSAKEVLTHLKEMVDDQTAYHEASVKRYSGIVKTLKKWGSAVFFAGFTFVVLRALFKFTTLVRPIPLVPLGNQGVTLRSFVGSASNMLAMLLPAWAAYFSTKLSQCNYQFNLDNHTRMVSSLKQIREQITMIETSFPEVSLEYVSALGESVARIMLGEDTSSWIRQYRK